MTTPMVTKITTPLMAIPAIVPTETEPLESEAIYIDVYQCGVVIILLCLCDVCIILCVHVCMCVCVHVYEERERKLCFYLIIHCTLSNRGWIYTN